MGQILIKGVLFGFKDVNIKIEDEQGREEAKKKPNTILYWHDSKRDW